MRMPLSNLYARTCSIAIAMAPICFTHSSWQLQSNAANLTDPTSGCVSPWMTHNGYDMSMECFVACELDY